jgi:hypothetical protein
MTLLLETKAKVRDIDQDDWPRCARCHMPVENFEIIDTGDSITLMAACHGAEELVTIPDSVWDTVGQGVSIGYAFQMEGQYSE